VHLKFAPVRTDELGERPLVAAAGALQQRPLAANRGMLCRGLLHQSRMPLPAGFPVGVPFGAAVVSA
jgi:hypothetical protein